MISKHLPEPHVTQENGTLFILSIMNTLDEENRLAWVSGFSGSAGVAVITLDEGQSGQKVHFYMCQSQQLL